MEKGLNRKVKSIMALGRRDASVESDRSGGAKPVCDERLTLVSSWTLCHGRGLYR